METTAYLRALFESAASVFSSVAGMNASHAGSALKDEHTCEMEVAVCLDVEGGGMGSLAMCMGADLADALCSALGGSNPDSALGDFFLQVAGGLADKTNGTPFEFTPGQLTVKRGGGENFTEMVHLPCMRMQLDVGGLQVVLLVSMFSAEADVVDDPDWDAGETASAGGGDDSSSALGPSGPGELTFEDDMDSLVDGFGVECDEFLEQMDQDLVALDENPGDMELVNSVFRALHTMKGNSLALGLDKLNAMVHKTEDVIRKVRDGEMNVTPEMLDVVFKAGDAIKALVQDVKERRRSTQDLLPIAEQLQAVLDGKVAPAEHKKAAEAAPKKKTAATTIRVDLTKLDGLIGVAGELVLSKNRLLNLVQEIESGGTVGDAEETLTEIFAQMSIQVSDLQTSVMSTRMQPIGKVFSKYPRVVRDLARGLGKEIDLIISGEDTELDNTIIEEISDPLIHLVRNSCDHGVETPDDREAAGKPRKGTVYLKAYQEGSFVVIEIQDDGNGMDPEVLKAKAIEKGLITVDEAREMPKGNALQLIFAAGFSTAAAVTAVSGRGVGMDVVKTNIGKLNGILELDSDVGVGTTLKIRLPLTLAVTTGLEVEVSGERYLIPEEAIVEIVRVPAKAYPTVQAEKKFLFRNSFWNPVFDLKDVVGLPPGEIGTQANAYIVVVGEVEKRSGVLVDNIVQRHEVVIKPLGKYIGNFAPVEINGATIMGDGKIELILNPNHLVSLGAARKEGLAA